MTPEQAKQILTDPENQPHQFGDGAFYCYNCQEIISPIKQDEQPQANDAEYEKAYFVRVLSFLQSTVTNDYAGSEEKEALINMTNGYLKEQIL